MDQLRAIGCRYRDGRGVDLRNTRLNMRVGRARPDLLGSVSFAAIAWRAPLHGRAGDMSFAADYHAPHLKLDIPDAAPKQLQGAVYSPPCGRAAVCSRARSGSAGRCAGLAA